MENNFPPENFIMLNMVINNWKNKITLFLNSTNIANFRWKIDLIIFLLHTLLATLGIKLQNSPCILEE